MLFSDATNDELVYVLRLENDSFILAKKEEIMEFDRHNLYAIKPDFQLSRTYTNLIAAKQVCEKMMELLGIKTIYKEEGLALMFEVVKLEKKDGKPFKGPRLIN